MIGATLPIHLAFWERTVIGAALLFALLPVVAVAWGHGWRVAAARARRATGPADAGPSGSLQPVADFGRALQSQDLLPAGGRSAVADGALVAGVAAVFAVTALVPVGPHQVVAAPGGAVVVAAAGLVLFGVAVASAGGRLTAARARTVAVATAVVAVAIAGASVSVGGVAAQAAVHAQAHGAIFGWGGLGLPGAWLHPLGTFAYTGAAAALVGVGPFRPAVADDPLAGTSGVRRWHWCWVRGAALLAASALGATVFLGGWALPGHPSVSSASAIGPAVLLVKVVVVAAAVASTELAWPPLTERARLAVLWWWLLPMAALDLVVTIVAKVAW